MTLTELRDRYADRAAEAERIAAQAPVAGVYRAVLADLEGLEAADFPSSIPAPMGAALLTVDEAAERLGVTPGWLYRRTRTLPFARKLGPKTLRYDAAGLAKWALAHRGGTG